MTHQEFNLDRHLSIENNIDAQGRKWEIVRSSRERALLRVKPNPYREDIECPREMVGEWTNKDLLQERIDKYLKRSWDHAESLAQKRAATERSKKREENETE